MVLVEMVMDFCELDFQWPHQVVAVEEVVAGWWWSGLVGLVCCCWSMVVLLMLVPVCCCCSLVELMVLMVLMVGTGCTLFSLLRVVTSPSICLWSFPFKNSSLLVANLLFHFASLSRFLTVACWYLVWPNISDIEAEFEVLLSSPSVDMISVCSRVEDVCR